jgi:predicted PurR-regulated permease PerM
MDLLPESVRRTAAWCAAVLLLAAVAATGIWLCIILKSAVVPVLLALLGTGLLAPLHRRLLRLGLHRTPAAGLTCVLLLAVGGGAVYIVVNAILETGDQIIASVKEAAGQLSERFGLVGNSLDDMASNAKDLFGKLAGPAASGLMSGLSLAGELVATAVLTLLLTFFFLRDSERAPALLRSLAPGAAGRRLESIGQVGFRAIEGFMRGTTLIALIDAVCITVGLLILRVPGAIGLGALVFVGAYIPYLGAFISGSVAVLVALADRGFAVALWSLGVVLAVQVLEGHVLQPMIQSRTVQLHPAVVLLSITAGAGLAGLVGMLLAVPFAAAAFGVLRAARAERSGRADRADRTGRAEGTQ